MIKGITVILHERVEGEPDPLGNPAISSKDVTVENVLVGSPSTEQIVETLNLYGKQLSYLLAIPKGDTNKWEDGTVTLPEPFAGTYRVIGYPTAGIEDNIPLSWNKQVRLERFG